MKITVNVDKSEIEGLIKDYVKTNLNLDITSITLNPNGATVISDTAGKKDEPKKETKEENKASNKEEQKVEQKVEPEKKEDAKDNSITSLLNTSLNLFS